MTNLLTKNISVSQLWTLMRSGWAWQSQYLFGEFDNTTWQSAAIWILAHKFVELLLRSGWDEMYAINATYDSIYDYNWETYIIEPTNFKKLVADTSVSDILNDFKTKRIKFGKSWSKEDLLKWLKWAIDSYLSEKIDYGNIEWVELSMEYDIVEKILDYKFESPVPFKAISDQVCRLTTDRQLIWANKEVLTIPAWSLFIEDTKFKDKHSEVSLDNPQYFFQAMFNYYCIQKEFGEAPAFMNFREIKTSKNRDWSSTHQLTTFIFSWEDFEIQKTFFWRYLIASFKYMEFLQENDVLYNVFDFISWTEAWAKQRAFYEGCKVEDLKTKMSVSNKSKTSWNNMSWHKFNLLDKWQKIEKWEIVTAVNTEDLIRSKLREFWVDIQYSKTIEWYSFDQMLFSLGRWVQVNKIKSLEQELCLATKIQGLRIVWVVWGTWLLGIEVPREDRKFIELKTYTRKAKGLKFPLGNTLDKSTIEIDLADPNYPHLLIQGTTWSWKSQILRIAVECLYWKAKLILVDTKLTELDETKWEYVTEDDVLFNVLNREYYNIKMRANLFKSVWVKDIEEYNKKVKPKDRIDHVVFIIDEMADLRLWDFWKEIESILEKISNVWRSAWIHLILASQRFDTKVLSWRLKNNIPTRISLRTWSEVDSRVLLDVWWAEKLLGKWDMLFKNSANIQRLQGFYIPS